jgi:hypothetical protein
MSDYLLLAEAARIVERSPIRLRTLINEGKLPSVKDERGRHRVRLHDVIGHFASLDDRQSLPNQPTDVPNDRLYEALREQIGMLQETLRIERAEKGHLMDEKAKLQSELLKLTAEVRAILTKETGNKPSNWFRR